MSTINTAVSWCRMHFLINHKPTEMTSNEIASAAHQDGNRSFEARESFFIGFAVNLQDKGVCCESLVDRVIHAAKSVKNAWGGKTGNSSRKYEALSL